MKTSIPSDVWETKRSEIAVLYKDEEWPLKQVIKRIRTEDFNPTETQLRSRLKKWGVTKPSRQRRKKSQAEKSSSSSPVTKKREGPSQLLSLQVPPPFPSDSVWSERKRFLSAMQGARQSKDASSGAAGNSGANLASIVPASHPPSVSSYELYTLSHLARGLPHSSGFRHYGHSQTGSGSNHHDETGSVCLSESLPSSAVVSPATDTFPGGISIGWEPHGTHGETDSQATLSPPSPWSYTPPEPCAPYSPTCVYHPDFLHSGGDKYSIEQHLTGNSEADFFEGAAAAARIWRRSSSCADHHGMFLPIKAVPPRKRRHDETFRGGHQEQRSPKRRDTDPAIQTPRVVTESGCSSSPGRVRLQALSSAESAYLLPGPIVN